jgi:peptidyl-prolyl cis-trans isomerase D
MRGIAPWIMVIVAVSFVGWMVFEVGMDVTGQTSGGIVDEVALVNGRPIDFQTFSVAVRQTTEQQRQAGAPTPSNMTEQRQLEDQVLEQLIQEILLAEEYERRGITVSDEEIRQLLLNAPLPEIQNIEIFQTEGQFDLAKYQRYLTSGADPGFALALEQRYRNELPRIKLMEQVTEDVYVSDAKLWRMFRDRADSATATVVAVVPQVAVDPAAVRITEEDIERYYRDHLDEFERPAQAFLSYVEISRRAAASDSAAALERAQSVRQEIVDGTEFELVAARESADSGNRELGGDLGDVPWGSFVPPFEDAVRAMRPGQISQPVLTPFGYHVIRLEALSDSGFHVRHILIPIELYGDHLEEVDRRADSLDVLAADQDDPTALDSVAAILGLQVGTAPPVYEGARLELGRYLLGDPSIWAFDASSGQTSPVIEADWAYYVFRLDSLVPVGVPPLEEIQREVAIATQREVLLMAARDVADSIVGAARGGATLEQAAAPHGLTAQTVGPFSRVSPSPVLRDTPEAVGAAFGLAPGAVGGPYESEMAFFIIEGVSVQRGDSATFLGQQEALRAELIRQAREARAQLVFSSLRQQADVVDRRAEIRRQLQQAPETGPFPTSPLGF